jgi:predicted SAM-dependent methyltransferase
VRVQLGCGHKPWPGWINIDGERSARYADLVADLRSLPLATGGADVAVAIHVLEHFYEWEAHEVLREWKRILKPGGRLVLELPSMDKVMDYMRQCLAQNQAFAMPMTWWAMWGDPKYKDPAMCHKWGYTERLLRHVLEQAGFVNIRAEAPRYHVKQRDMRMIAEKGML